jgi:hypothetical protein
MKKFMIFTIVLYFMFMIQGCERLSDDVEITAGKTPTSEEALEIQSLQEEGYLFAVKISTDLEGRNTQTLYIWDQQLRIDLHDLLIDTMNQVMDLSKINLRFEIDIDHDIVMTASRYMVMQSDINLEGLLMASMFPIEFNVSKSQFVMDMAPVVAYIEANMHSGSLEIIWVKTVSNQSMLIQNASMVDNEVYAFNDLDEYLTFLGMSE